MDSQELKCPCGHSWERPISGPVPTDIREICPVCTPGIQAASSPTVTDTPQQGTLLKPGEELAGFEILQPISRGGMGVIYKARQTGLNRMAALKVIAPERLGGKDHAEYVERFRREVRAAALLNHPNIVTVYATDLTGPRPYLAMEFVDGIDLYKLVQMNGPLGFEESAEYMRQAALGLQHAFECGMVHRDIKPHNLMITPSPLDATPGSASRRKPTIKILDMGLARLDEADEGLQQGLTQAEAFLGTPDYAAPEQAEDSRLADTRADLYSLGATWFFLLTGEVPFPGSSLMQKLRKQLTQPTPLVTEHRVDAPTSLVALIRKLMDRDPAERFQTPAEVADAIGDFMRDPSRTPDWVIESAKPLSVQAHAGAVSALCLNGDGRLILTGGDDEKLRLWNAPALDEVRTVSGNPGLVSGAAIIGSGKWGASCALRLMPQDMVVQLWDLNAGIERLRLSGPKENLVCVALSVDGRRVIAGSRDGTIHVWILDPPDAKPVVFKAHNSTVTGVAFAPDGNVLSVGVDGTMRQWDIDRARGRELLRGGAGALRAVAVAKSNDDIAIAGESLLVRKPDGTTLTLTGQKDSLCVAISADGAIVASGGSDGIVRIWQTSDGTELAASEAHDAPVRAVAISNDCRFVYSGSADGMLRRWAIASVAIPRRRA